MDFFPVISGAQTFMITGNFGHAGGEGKLPTLANDARVVTFITNVRAISFGDYSVPVSGPTPTFVIPPGQEVRFTPNQQSVTRWLACGFLLPKEPNVLAPAILAARKEFDEQLNAAKDGFDAKIRAIQESLKNASVEALRASALEVLIKETTTGVVDAIPEKLAIAIRAHVDEAVAKALANLGRG